MKRTDLLKRLAEVGDLEFVREGARHTIFLVKGNIVAVPRHREINEITAIEIIRDAEDQLKHGRTKAAGECLRLLRRLILEST